MKFKLLIASAIAALVSSSAFAPAFAVTDAECNTMWKAADANGDGMITEAESARTFAQLRVGGQQIADGNLSQATFLTHCKAGLLNPMDAGAMDTAAPLEGANSFTEAQAKDRIVAAGYANVSALTKDGKGIWRGTISDGTTNKNVAVDYKGNVVIK